MMRRMSHARRDRGEPTLPLINIVFLMLIFFLAAAQLSRPLEADLQLVSTDDPDLVPPPDALVLMADGTVRFRGQVASAAEAVEQLRSAEAPLTVRILPDRRADAVQLVDLASQLRGAGAEAVYVVTQRALK